jgi:hypothetical protein
MNTPIYGRISVSSSSASDPNMPLVPQLLSQVTSVLSQLSGNNKEATIKQIDNIRHQLLVIIGKHPEFTPFTTTIGASTQRDIRVSATGDLEYYDPRQK